MSIRLALCLSAVALASCAAPEAYRTQDHRITRIGPPTPCDADGACQVYIDVHDCGVAGSGLTVLPDHIGIDKAKKIHWRIVGDSGYHFPPDGIVASDGIVVNGGGFTRKPGVSRDGTVFILQNDHSESRNPIKYSIHVLNKDGTECTRYDPFITNGA